MAELWRATQQGEQLVALLARCDGRTRATNWQDAVLPVGLIQAIGQVVAQVSVADGLAGRQTPITEQQKRLAAPHPLNLPRQRLEKRSGPHN